LSGYDPKQGIDLGNPTSGRTQNWPLCARPDSAHLVVIELVIGREDLISYQNDGKVGMVIVGEVGMA
jgi:hypothetical protein